MTLANKKYRQMKAQEKYRRTKNKYQNNATKLEVYLVVIVLFLIAVFNKVL